MILELAEYVLKQCPYLLFKGLMTIGATGDLTCFDRSKGIILIFTLFFSIVLDADEYVFLMLIHFSLINFFFCS